MSKIIIWFTTLLYRIYILIFCILFDVYIKHPKSTPFLLHHINAPWNSLALIMNVYYHDLNVETGFSSNKHQKIKKQWFCLVKRWCFSYSVSLLISIKMGQVSIHGKDGGGTMMRGRVLHNQSQYWVVCEGDGGGGGGGTCHCCSLGSLPPINGDSDIIKTKLHATGLWRKGVTFPPLLALVAPLTWPAVTSTDKSGRYRLV